jgi:hypothetical protein
MAGHTIHDGFVGCKKVSSRSQVTALDSHALLLILLLRHKCAWQNKKQECSEDNKNALHLFSPDVNIRAYPESPSGKNSDNGTLRYALTGWRGKGGGRQA